MTKLNKKIITIASLVVLVLAVSLLWVTKPQKLAGFFASVKTSLPFQKTVVNSGPVADPTTSDQKRKQDKLGDLSSNDGDDTTADHIVDLDSEGDLVQVDKNNLTKEQQEATDKLGKQYELYKPTLLKSIDLLRGQDLEGLVGLTNSCIINKFGSDNITSSYSDSYIPFFQDYKSMDLDAATVSPYIGPCSDEGLVIGEIITTVSGAKKNFVIAIIRDASGIKIAGITLNKKVEDFH